MAGLKHVGNYTIIRQLGEGGMGSVYLAKSPDSDTPVAVKVIRSEVIEKPTIEKRFYREISLCKTFAHPYVIKVIDGGVDSEQKILFLVMENLQGSSLMDVIKNHGKIDVSQAVTIYTHLAEALAYVHPMGIIHRDIKPDNVFIVSPERTVLLDFGLAFTEEGTKLSGTRDRIGTLPLMSPEQLRAESPTETSDIYNLGMTMYYALTRHIPYSIDQLTLITMGKPVPPLSSPARLRKSIPSFLSDIVMKSIDLDKRKRFQTAAELKTALTEGAKRQYAGKKTAKISVKDVKEAAREATPLKPPPLKKTPQVENESRNHSVIASSQSSTYENPVTNPKWKAFLLVMTLILCGVFSTIFLRSPETQSPSEIPARDLTDINTLSHSLLEKTRLIVSAKDFHGFVQWMTAVDTLFTKVEAYKERPNAQPHKLVFPQTIAGMKDILNSSPLLPFLQGRLFEYENNFFEAAVNYRDTGSVLLREQPSPFDSETRREFSRLILEKIGHTLSKNKQEPLHCTKDELSKWNSFWMNLPPAETLSDNVFFLRCWIFLSEALYGQEHPRLSAEEQKIVYPACSLLLNGSRTRALSKRKQEFLLELFTYGKLVPPQAQELTEEPYKEVRSIRNAYSRHLSELMITKEQLSYQQTLKRNYRRAHWSMMAKLILSRKIPTSQLSLLWRRIPNIEKDLRPLPVMNRTIAVKYEQLRLMRCIMATLPTETPVSVRLSHELRSIKYAIYDLASDEAPPLTKELIHFWSGLCSIYTRDPVLSHFVEIVSGKGEKNFQTMIDELVRNLNHMARENENLNVSAYVLHTMEVLRLFTFMLCNRIITDWPKTYDLSLFKKITPIGDLLADQYRKAMKTTAEPQKPFHSLYYCDIPVSFIEKLYETGVTKEDCKVFRNILMRKYGIPFSTEHLWRNTHTQPDTHVPWQVPASR